MRAILQRIAKTVGLGDLYAHVGAGLLAYGAYLVEPAVGFIVGGACLLYFEYLMRP